MVNTTLRKYGNLERRKAELEVKLGKMTTLKEAKNGLLFVEGNGEIIFKRSVVKTDGTQKMWLYDMSGRPTQCYTENAACRRVNIKNKET